MMAMHRIANRGMIEEMVERLGRARTEEVRTALRAALLALGAEVVTPLVRSLVAASDLSARRAYRDALVELDRVGVPLLEDMIGDERWFVVRNMVGILGEIRSADAVDHFARTIRHSDVRVRRETIIALSKVGGEEAVQQLAVGLNDARRRCARRRRWGWGSPRRHRGGPAAQAPGRGDRPGHGGGDRARARPHRRPARGAGAGRARLGREPLLAHSRAHPPGGRCARSATSGARRRAPSSTA
jgi:hypothetical protein